jgi:hypothetical protein
MKALEIGGRVYYTGDIANAPGHFRIISSNGREHILQEEPNGDGRQFLGIPDHAIGRVYFGHCNPRFVTQQARDAFRAERLLQLRQAAVAAAT